MSDTCSETPGHPSHFETPSVQVMAALVRDIVELGGYTHPLFRPADPEAAGRVPLPGQGVLLLAGGLVERSGLLDDAVAMLEIREVSFAAMVRPGDEIRVRMTPGPHRDSRGGRAVQEFDWQVLAADDSAVARATVLMLMEHPVPRDATRENSVREPPEPNAATEERTS